MATRLKIGDKVRCGRYVRTVVYLYPNIGGGVKLDCAVNNFRSWNEDELKFIRHATKLEM